MTEHEVSNDIDSIRAWVDRMRPRAEVAALLDAGGGRADVARVDVLLAEIDRLSAEGCPHVVRGEEGTAFCGLAARDAERVQREHRVELGRLRLFREDVAQLVSAFDTTAERYGQKAANVALSKFVADLWAAIDKHDLALLDQKEQST